MPDSPAKVIRGDGQPTGRALLVIACSVQPRRTEYTEGRKGHEEGSLTARPVSLSNFLCATEVQILLFASFCESARLVVGDSPPR